MATTYSSLVHINGNLFTAIDLETMGRRVGCQEIIQIVFVPLTSDLRPSSDSTPFCTNVRPQYPERAERRATNVHGLDTAQLMLHGLDSDRVRDRLVESFMRLDLPADKCLVPLAHNWSFEYSFLSHWLGVDLLSGLFHAHARDAMQLALAINDRSAFAGEPAAFSRVPLASLCNRLGVGNSQAHDAMADCLAEAEVYRALLVRKLL